MRQIGGDEGEERVGGGWKTIERWLVWRLKDGWGWVEVSDGCRRVGKRLVGGWIGVEDSERRTDVVGARARSPAPLLC